MKVYKSGTRVKTVIGDIEALITSVSMRQGSIAYELSYFVNGSYCQIWLHEFEFTVCPTKKKPGFVNYDTEDIKLLTNGEQVDI